MRSRTLLSLALGGTAVLAFGVWLGTQRASADRAPSAASSERAAPAQIAFSAHTPTRVYRPALPPKPVAPGLAEDLRDPDPRVRRNAIAELAASDAPDPRALVEASRDTDLGVAVAATEGLGTLYRNGQLPAQELIARITDRAAPDKVRVSAINGLGVVPSPDGAATLAELVARGTEVDRRSAAILLAHQDPSIAVPALIGALRDADEIVRANAREALRSIARGRDLGDDPAAWQQWWQSRSR